MYPISEMEVDVLKRTRAKTPCFWIGQLEAKARTCDSNHLSAALAGQYQAMLPARTFTPCSEADITLVPKKSLRKMKGRSSLRELVTCQELSLHSDTETLVGTPPLGSPSSQCFSFRSRNDQLESDEDPQPVFLDIENQEQDVGFQMCLDLLTSELSTGLSKSHPTTNKETSSGLQILLMIEAYEAIQKQIQDEIDGGHVTGEKLEQAKDVEQSLSNWLDALNALYDKERSTKLVVKSREEKRTSSRLSVRPLNSSRQASSDSDDIYYDFDIIT